MIAKGQKISDRYKIIKSIGEGGMANVYLAYDTILERNVAVKVLRGDLSGDEKFVRRFQREALSASSLSNENIVEVYDVGEDHGEYYIVMEYVEGKHLKNLLKKRGKLTVAEVVDIMLQVTSGLSVAHDSYIIHRDIKPQNIMILENGLVKIADFGIAVAMNSTQLTQTNSVMGSVHYLPPEQASGKGATLQSDIYSLGILMYELLTGKLPFRGDNAVEIALKHLKEPMPSVRSEIPDIPQSIENIILKATAKNPKNRYADAREMYEDLKTCTDPSREAEEKLSYRYPESDYDETKILKVKKTDDDDKKKKSKKEIKTESDEVIATQITEGDLKSQNKTMITLVAIFTGLVVIITTIVLLLPVITRSASNKIPDITNMTISEATKALEKEGFEIEELIDASSRTIEEGRVIKTNPPAGKSRKQGTGVKVYVSEGNKEIKVEDYTGKNLDYIRGVLEGKGIKVIVKTKDLLEGEDPADYDENVIIEQDIKAGEYISKGDTITLYIPNIKNEYPDFTNGTFSIYDIVEFCDTYQLKCSFVDSKTKKTIPMDDALSDEYAYATISSQNRTAGTKVTSGASLKISITLPTSDEPEEPDEDNGGLD